MPRASRPAKRLNAWTLATSIQKQDAGVLVIGTNEGVWAQASRSFAKSASGHITTLTSQAPDNVDTTNLLNVPPRRGKPAPQLGTPLAIQAGQVNDSVLDGLKQAERTVKRRWLKRHLAI